MDTFFCIVLIFGLLCALFSFGLFYFVFYVFPRKKEADETIDLPKGKIYDVYWEQMRNWIWEKRRFPHEDFYIRSFDGLKLHAEYFELAQGAPIELMFHGYRGSAERDMSGGVQRSFQVGHSVLLIDQRCSGMSDGNVITFGIREHRDCLDWINFTVEHFGPDVKIILTGISMGAATVLMAAGRTLPPNVVGVLADCGYNSPRDVIIHVAQSMHFPSSFLYPFVKMGAKIFGHFDLEAYSPEEALRNCTVPVIFFHGEDDDYVPSYMSKRNYDICPSRKKLVLIPGAGHGLSFPVSPEKYIREVKNFFNSDQLDNSGIP